MGETRVKLRHLLENMRDEYPFSLEEAIITELIANALDARASSIWITTNSQQQIMTIVDDGEGMDEQGLSDYHDIAATTKKKGRGIGFAGQGAKLALLTAKQIVTETKRLSFHKATSWSLCDQRAPWKWIEPVGSVQTPSGTAVRIALFCGDSDLLDDQLIERTIVKHFYPLLDNDVACKVLRHYYKSGVRFSVNGRSLLLPKAPTDLQKRCFMVQSGPRRSPIGYGYLAESKEDLSEGEIGLAVSTLGKVIKRDWTWIGVRPKDPWHLTGIVEVPMLCDALTTNKADFMKGPIFYKYRKAIQDSIMPVIRKLGQIDEAKERPDDVLKPVERELKQVLSDMLSTYPELEMVLGRRRTGDPVKVVIPKSDAQPVGTPVEGVDAITGAGERRGQGNRPDVGPGQMPGEHIEAGGEPILKGIETQVRKQRPGLMIGFADESEREELGWLLENTIMINRGHPAYGRVADAKAENYHIIVTVAWVLAGHLEEGKSPQDFVSRFLRAWGYRA